MTLSQFFMAGLLSLAGLAQAYVVPGNNYGPGDHYGPSYPSVPAMPTVPYEPVRPRDPVRPGQPGSQIFKKEARIGRYVRNETLNLRRLADIGLNYRGFRVESVNVVMRPTNYNTHASLQLIINRRVADERSLYREATLVLHPRGSAEIGDDVNSLQLAVRGEVFIEGVIIELSQAGGYHPNPPDYGREIYVDLPIPGYLPPQGYLDLTAYIDVRRYRGMAIVGLDITANARNNAAFINVLLNNFQESVVSLTRYSSTQRVQTRQRLVLGENFRSLVLSPRGDTNLTAVRLILRRY